MKSASRIHIGTRFRRRVADPELSYRLAVVLLSIVTFIHLLSLPLAASYDGMEYVRLAHSVWNYLQTPGFPSALKLAFFVGGEQPQAAMMVTCLAGVAGVLLTGSVVRTVAGNAAGAVTLLVLTFYPVLVCYEHMLLPETGVFFFLALLVWLLVRSRVQAQPFSGSLALLLAFVTALGYHWRPIIIYLSPAVALGYLLVTYLPPDNFHPYREFWSNIQKHWRGAIGGFAAVALGPLLLAYPWIHLSSQGPSTDPLELTTHAPDGKTRRFSQSVFQLWPPEQNFQHAPGWISDSKQFAPRPYAGGAFTGRLFGALGPFYTWFTLLSSIVSFWWFLATLRGGNTRGLIMAGIPLAFLFLHPLTMMAGTRHAFPAYPLIMANCVALASLAVRGWINKRMPDTL